MSTPQSSNHSEVDYDVIVVGGGPAGVSCAITVAQQGYSVVIVDKKKRDQIGDKTCGDAIDLAALERVSKGIGLEVPHDKEVSDPIKRMSIAAGSIENKITLIAPGFVLDRHVYGQRLINQAEKLGVEIISGSPVRDLLIEDIDGEKYLQGIKIKNGKSEREIRAQFTIDASGAYAVIRKQLPDDLLMDGLTRNLTDDELWPTYREIIEFDRDLDDHKFDNEIILLYKNEFAPPGYFWIFSKGKRRLNCGIGWMKYQSKDLGKVKAGYLKEMEQYYKRDSYQVIKQGGGQIPVRPPFDSLVFNGGAIAGDAACMVHPVTAEGHAPALDTAMHLGNSIVSALKDGQRNKASLWGYNVAVSRHYAKKHTQALIMRNFMEKVGASKLEYLIKKQIFRNEELDLIFSGDELNLSLKDKLLRALKLIHKPGLLIWLKRIFDGMDACDRIYNEYPDNPIDLPEWRKRRNNKLNLNF